MKTTSYRVEAGDSESRLDTFVAARAGITRSRVKNLIAEGHVTVAGAPASKAGQLLQEGEEVVVSIPAPVKTELTARDVGLRILYEDESLAVLEKPAGLSVHPSTTETGDTVVHGLLHALKSISTVGGVERPGIVHRIDKGTSGILVVSKTDAAHLALAAQFKDHTIDRRYQALVYGDLSRKGKSGRIETFFARSLSNRKKMTGKGTSGRRAITEWNVLETFRFGRLALSLVECRLHTGRTHQIRVHLSEFGFPLAGDPLYGDHTRHASAIKKENSEVGGFLASLSHQLLHAYRLGFNHPDDQRALEFESPLPVEFARALELAREHAQRRE